MGPQRYWSRHARRLRVPIRPRVLSGKFHESLCSPNPKPWPLLIVQQHHGFIDRNFRIWQNQNSGVRTTTIGGTDSQGNALTLNTKINVYDFRPDVRIGDVLDTTKTLCYKYNY